MNQMSKIPKGPWLLCIRISFFLSKTIIRWVFMVVSTWKTAKRSTSIHPKKQRRLVCQCIPVTPSRDTNRHDDIDDHLGKEDEEEDKEIEGAVTPKDERKRNDRWKFGPTRFGLVLRRWHKPEGFVNRSVPTYKGAGSEEDSPEDGKAHADTATRRVHTEHSHGGDQVEDHCASADWTLKKRKG